MRVASLPRRLHLLSCGTDGPCGLYLIESVSPAHTLSDSEVKMLSLGGGLSRWLVGTFLIRLISDLGRPNPIAVNPPPLIQSDWSPLSLHEQCDWSSQLPLTDCEQALNIHVMFIITPLVSQWDHYLYDSLSYTSWYITAFIHLSMDCRSVKGIFFLIKCNYDVYSN